MPADRPDLHGGHAGFVSRAQVDSAMALEKETKTHVELARKARNSIEKFRLSIAPDFASAQAKNSRENNVYAVFVCSLFTSKKTLIKISVNRRFYGKITPNDRV